MKYIKKYNENIDWDWVEEEMDDGINIGDLVKAKGQVVFYDRDNKKIYHTFADGIDKVFKVDHIKIENDGEILIKLNGHWPWFISYYFRKVDKSYSKYL